METVGEAKRGGDGFVYQDIIKIPVGPWQDLKIG